MPSVKAPVRTSPLPHGFFLPPGLPRQSPNGKARGICWRGPAPNIFGGEEAAIEGRQSWKARFDFFFWKNTVYRNTFFDEETFYASILFMVRSGRFVRHADHIAPAGRLDVG
jgi:hypothetical protein